MDLHVVESDSPQMMLNLLGDAIRLELE